MDRRGFVKLITATALMAPFGGKVWAMGLFSGQDRERDKGDQPGRQAFPFKLSKEEWRKRLSEQQYHVLREQGTERAFSSPLNAEKRNGSFLCAGCENLLFLSKNKFDSGTGWPSFWKPAADNSVGTSTDYKLAAPRTEVHCANCGGHLGHVFKDGPPPTGLRYCMNGVAMIFRPA